jgi:hypothetical protein
VLAPADVEGRNEGRVVVGDCDCRRRVTRLPLRRVARRQLAVRPPRLCQPRSVDNAYSRSLPGLKRQRPRQRSIDRIRAVNSSHGIGGRRAGSGTGRPHPGPSGPACGGSDHQARRLARRELSTRRGRGASRDRGRPREGALADGGGAHVSLLAVPSGDSAPARYHAIVTRRARKREHDAGWNRRLPNVQRKAARPGTEKSGAGRMAQGASAGRSDSGHLDDAAGPRSFYD